MKPPSAWKIKERKRPETKSRPRKESRTTGDGQNKFTRRRFVRMTVTPETNVNLAMPASVVIRAERGSVTRSRFARQDAFTLSGRGLECSDMLRLTEPRSETSRRKASSLVSVKRNGSLGDSTWPSQKTTLTWPSHGVAKDSSPRREPWDLMSVGASPGWGGRNVLAGEIFLSLLP